MSEPPSPNPKSEACAACGRAGEDLRTCTACRLVRYCGVACQRADRPRHRRECRRRAAELRDEALFRQPPPREDCPICFRRLPIEGSSKFYQACCGKTLCQGCFVANKKARSCPFCRASLSHWQSNEEIIKMYRKRMEKDDAAAIGQMGWFYSRGRTGLPKDMREAVKLWHRAAELGCAEAHHLLYAAYQNGNGVEKDAKKAIYFAEVAAMGGNNEARYNLGVDEANAGNMQRAMKHWAISAGEGCDDSLAGIKRGFLLGVVTKDDFEKALRAHQCSQDEMKSHQREEAKEFVQKYCSHLL